MEANYPLHYIASKGRLSIQKPANAVLVSRETAAPRPEESPGRVDMWSESERCDPVCHLRTVSEPPRGTAIKDFLKWRRQYFVASKAFSDANR